MPPARPADVGVAVRIAYGVGREEPRGRALSANRVGRDVDGGRREAQISLLTAAWIPLLRFNRGGSEPGVRRGRLFSPCKASSPLLGAARGPPREPDRSGWRRGLPQLGLRGDEAWDAGSQQVAGSQIRRPVTPLPLRRAPCPEEPGEGQTARWRAWGWCHQHLMAVSSPARLLQCVSPGVESAREGLAEGALLSQPSQQVGQRENLVRQGQGSVADQRTAGNHSDEPLLWKCMQEGLRPPGHTARCSCQKRTERPQAPLSAHGVSRSCSTYHRHLNLFASGVVPKLM